MAATYFILTSISTVGFGDIHPTNNYEKIFCIVISIFGVLLFTFISGALSSVLTNYDN